MQNTVQPKKRNATFAILSAIGILLILLGHLDFPILTGGGLFPYYSYHVMIFPFISGYFYNPLEEENIPAYILHKCRRLLLPYFIWNVVYGILATLLHSCGFSIGEPISLYNLFIAPFMGGHQFLYNAAAWFVPALFLLETCNIIGRKFLSLIRMQNEIILFILYLLIGCVAVYLSKRGSVYDFYRLPARIMFLAPAFQFGRIYRTNLEKKDSLPDILYFPLLFFVQLLLLTNNAGLAFSAVWVSSFANAPIVPYLTTFTGILLWLRVSKILTPILQDSRPVMYLSMNTYSVMMHHITAFMLVKAFFFALSFLSSRYADFDRFSFMNDLYYTYLPNGIEAYNWIYLAAGIILPLFIHYTGEKITKSLIDRRNGVCDVGCRPMERL